jgi:hypothetical protein
VDEQATIQTLEALVIDNPQLDQLEALIAEFNIFEAMGAVRQELRHSDFLAFLLNPHEKHGLDDIFLKKFLVRVLSDANDPPVSPITINVTDLSDALVERESHHIDILIHDSASGLVCVIENKVFSGEHSKQLNRYLKAVAGRFPNAKAIIPIFLTPDGISPSDEESPYIPFSYGQVAGIIEGVREAQASVLGPDVNTMMSHYVTMLRRHIVSDSDIAELCRQIYAAHKSAIDLIVEHMPDQRQEMANHLATLIAEQPELEMAYHTKTYVDFVPKEWLSVPELNLGYGLLPHSQAVLSLQFNNRSDHLTLYLELGPVQSQYEYIREAIFAHARANADVFKGCRPKLSKQWTVLYSLKLLRSSDFKDATSDDLMNLLQPKWERFLREILPELHEQVMSIAFPPQT